MTSSKRFFKGFLIGLTVFLFINIFAAHFFSDCGLPALFGLGGCADAISRLGFPFVFFEQGGFAYHSTLNPPFFILDLVIGFGVAMGTGFFFNRKKK